MTTEEKQLLLKDLCARLPYGVMMGNKKLKETSYRLSGKDIDDAEFDDDFDDLPYLRPMSSMTEEEIKEWDNICIMMRNMPIESIPMIERFVNSKYLDFRNLIPTELALPAPDGMYNF